MRTVHKYPFDIADCFRLELPRGYKPLLVECQAGQPCLWAEVSSDAPKQQETFRVTGTGHPVTAAAEHVGSFQQGSFVWHLWKVSA